MLYLRIRKTLGTLLSLVTSLCERPRELAESGVLQRILELNSIREVNRLLPEEILNVRNLFQLLLAQTFTVLKNARDKALADQELSPEPRKELEETILPFEKACMAFD